MQLLSLTQGGTWTSEDIPNVLVAPVVEVDSIAAVVHEGHRAIYHLAIPKTDDHVWQGQLVQFWDQIWSVVGIPTRGIDELIPGPWNTKVTVELYHTAPPSGESLWIDTVTFPAALVTQDADGYESKTDGTARESRVIFVEGVNADRKGENGKEGMRRTATVEIWTGDYQGDRQLNHDGTLYNITRYEQTGRGSLLLYLEEVWR